MQQVFSPDQQNSLPNNIGDVANAISNQLTQPLAETESLTTHSSSFYHFIFILFDEITRLHIQSTLFYFLQIIFCSVHIISANWYSYLPEAWNDSTIYGKVIIGLNHVLMFGPTNDPKDPPLTLILVPFLVISVIAILFFSTLWVLRNAGTINQYLVYLAAFILQVCLYIVFLPAFVAFGTTFQFLLQRDAVSIVFFILYLFILAFAIVAVYMQNKLINFSTNPNISLFATYDGKHLSNLLVFTGVTIILTNMSKLFQKWFYFVAIIVHVIFMIYQIYDLFEFSIVKFYMIYLFGAFYCASIVTDVLTLFTLFSSFDTELIRIVAPIGVFLVSLIVFYFIFNARIKAVCAIIDPCDVPELEKTDYYTNIECKNVRQAKVYIHIGLNMLKQVVLDCSLGITLATRFKSADLWLLTANIAAFIPSNKSQLNDAIINIQASFSKSIYHKLLLDRLLKLEQSRLLVSSLEINNRISAMKTKSDEVINSIKQFWYEVSNRDERATIASINAISVLINDTQRMWDEMLSMYPNESKLAAEYSNFLIEGLGKFELGIIWKLKSGHLEKGYHSGIDKLFQAFVVAMPKIWFDRIVDRLGNLTASHPEANNYTMTVTTTAQDKLEEDLEVGMLDQVALQIFQWPRLRMNLTRATSHYRPTGLGIFRIFKYIAFLIWILLNIIVAVFYSSTFDNITVSYMRIESIVTVRQALDYLRALIFMNHAKKAGILYTEEEYASTLPEEAILETNLAFNYINFTEDFKNWSTRCLDSFMEMYQTLANSGLDGENVTRSVSVFLNESIPTTKDETDMDETLKTSTKNAIVSLLWHYESFSDMDHEKYENPPQSSTLQETLILHQQFSLKSDDVLNDFALQAQENNNSTQQFLKTIVIIGLVLTIAICIPLMFVPMVIIYIETNRLFRALKSVSPEGAKAASKQIANSSEQSIDFSAVGSINSSSGALIGMFAIYIFLYIASIILCAISYSVLKTKGSYIAELIGLSRFGSVRDALVIEIFSDVLMLAVGYSQKEDNYLKQFIPDILGYYNTAVSLLTKYHSNFFRGYDGNEGIYTISSKIRDFHNVDKCSSDLAQGEMHPFYSCIALDRLISTFILYSSYFAAEENKDSYPLNGVNFINLLHVTTAELYRSLYESRDMMSELIDSNAKNAEIISIILLMISLIIILINILIDYKLEKTLMKSLKTTLILLRHLPPPVVAETNEIIDLLLVKKNEESEEIFDPKQIIFNTTQTPIICIGDGFIIETINKAFRKAFNFSTEQLVGRKLTSLIEEPHENEGDKSIEEQGAFRMYEK
ncbi:hypothetical protein TRFO_02483 [Tritrichomonas foetus]|uniref:PAS domain-containing protein n=1 Tax=Tritrichomonas foetus TaxID=1144522 RepID=A0A1J4L1Z6_9EUKA|nr:hypothetical protein TRFO_02483 [Tritrichomonas foetus]|eukprot:OHT17467.1 hypothetical protein TRFO_02483 [Tritrichomonas foetus]